MSEISDHQKVVFKKLSSQSLQFMTHSRMDLFVIGYVNTVDPNAPVTFIWLDQTYLCVRPKTPTGICF